MQTEEIRDLLIKNKKKNMIFYTLNGFRFEAKILEIGSSIVLFSDLKKGNDKMLQLSEIKEVDFL